MAYTIRFSYSTDSTKLDNSTVQYYTNTSAHNIIVSTIHTDYKCIMEDTLVDQCFRISAKSILL